MTVFPEDPGPTAKALIGSFGIISVGDCLISYSGVFWVLGRYDRAWGPERDIYGKIRYMTSDSAARKFNLKPYLEKWGNPAREASTTI